MFTVIELEQGSPEWLKWRRSRITATMPAVIMGESPWMTPNELWKSICLGEEKPFYSQAAEWGKIHEEPARIYAEKLLGCKIDKGPCIESVEKYSFNAAASLDGCIGLRHRMGGDKVGNPQHDLFSCDAIVEIKCPGEKNFQAFRDEIPLHYMIQMHWQMMVAGCKKAYFICFRNFEIYSHAIDYDEELAIEMLQAVKAFQKNIDDFEEPPLLDADCPKSEDPEDLALAKRYLELDEAEKKFKEEKERIKLHLQNQATAGGYQRMQFGSLKYSRCETTRTSYDIEAMAKDHGIDVDSYKKCTRFFKTNITRCNE